VRPSRASLVNGFGWKELPAHGASLAHPPLAGDRGFPLLGRRGALRASGQAKTLQPGSLPAPCTSRFLNSQPDMVFTTLPIGQLPEKKRELWHPNLLGRELPPARLLPISRIGSAATCADQAGRYLLDRGQSITQYNDIQKPERGNRGKA